MGGDGAVRQADDLARFGGKGANLVRLREAGLPVPPFVLLGTHEYRAFVAEHDLDQAIDDALNLPPGAASERIRASFRRPVAEEQARRIAQLVEPLLPGPVAVRSSATAEDLPDASFAGQQDTFLDIEGLDDILTAVVECWSSLWTERAIAYRHSHQVDHAEVSLAVVVQEMVPAEAAGVLFTADPLSGRRGVVSIDAVAGLGEKLVSGQVTPDHYEVDGAGAVTTWQIHGGRSVLSMAQVRGLAALGRRIEGAMGAPQDIEWVTVGDRLSVVQSRPITSLFPVPEGPQHAVWFSFGAFQGMLEPITPAGRDTLRALLAGAAGVFGAPTEGRDNTYVRPAAERLWIRLDGLLRTRIGNRVLPLMLNAVDPNAAAALKRLRHEVRDVPRQGSVGSVGRAALRAGGQVLPNLVLALRRPEALRGRIDEVASALLQRLERELARAASQSGPRDRLDARIQAVEGFAASTFPALLPVFAPVMACSALGMLRLRALARASGVPEPDRVALGALRALPGNVTTEMDLRLWRVATQIGADPVSRQVFAEADVAELARRWLSCALPGPAQRAVDDFMADYGMRGVAEIDLGVPRWRSVPEGVLQSIATYLNSPPAEPPDLAFERSEREAEADLRALADAVGGLRGAQVRFLGRLVRSLFGARETPKFVIVKCLGMLREALLDSGEDLVATGHLASADDIFLLHLDELTSAFDGSALTALVAQRAETRAREQRRARIPVALVGDGRAFFDGGGDTGADLVGMGVSPGVVEGVARIVEHPGDSRLSAGEILVCRGTDPAWTPLFLTAVGLVTEVGGLMTHGSVVAREYGLPAVVGVVDATGRIADGQRIRLDGTTGSIELFQ